MDPVLFEQVKELLKMVLDAFGAIALTLWSVWLTHQVRKIRNGDAGNGGGTDAKSSG